MDRPSPWESWTPAVDPGDFRSEAGEGDGDADGEGDRERGAPDRGSGSDGGAGASPAERLRGLIDSDDDGDDDDFQDLMTADDDELFGTAAAVSRPMEAEDDRSTLRKQNHGSGGDVGDGNVGDEAGEGLGNEVGGDGSDGEVEGRGELGNAWAAVPRIGGGRPPLGPNGPGGRLEAPRASTDSGSRRSSNGFQSDNSPRKTVTSDGAGGPPLSARTAVSDGAVDVSSSVGPRDSRCLPSLRTTQYVATAHASVHPLRSPRDSHKSIASLESTSAPPLDAAADGSTAPFGLGGISSMPPQRFVPLSSGHVVGGGFNSAAWAVQGPVGGNGGLAFGALGRFPAAAVQHYGSGQVYKSLPISQPISSATEDGSEVVAGAGGHGARNSGLSHSRQSGRNGRHAVTTPPASTSGSVSFSSSRERSRAMLPGHASNSPHRPRVMLASSGSPVTAHHTVPVGGGSEPPCTPLGGRSRSPKRTIIAPAAPPSTMVLGGVVLPIGPIDLLAEAQDGGHDAVETATHGSHHHDVMPRGPIVPTLPQHRSSGIRHCGFMHAPGGIAASSTVSAPPPPPAAAYGAGAHGLGHGVFGSSLPSKAGKVASARIAEDRSKSAMFARLRRGWQQ
ncbi:hypothetical protein GPECTOR_22g782 [Gonium pectorale]|uniref:Uncharacterized protein n=1 Tax=Gonium pectorale TaxID=33097 RepID=A0A150GH71_GONPE|nr:hypothetical protein GPECTOR_22g782 [Gonium pectorale]|eukprot:KXZ49192.1 hypothetical protein GPECTOR_22g782 [Gonium pectorale]